MYEGVVKLVRTKDELLDLQEAVDELEAALYKAGSDFDSVMKNKVSAKLAQAMRGEIASGVEANKYLKGLKDELRELVPVKVTLSFWPSEGLIDKMSEWLKENKGEKTVVEINRDKSIIGGLTISSEGKYGDFSIAKAIEASKEQDTTNK